MTLPPIDAGRARDLIGRFAGLPVLVAGGGIGMLLSHPGIWRSRPLDDWTEHPEVTRYKAAGWEVWRTESPGIDLSTT